MLTKNQYHAAKQRLEFPQKVNQALCELLTATYAKSPWLQNCNDLAEAKAYLKDTVSDLFYDAAQEDREGVEEYERREHRRDLREWRTV